MNLKVLLLAGCLTGWLAAPARAGDPVIVEHRLERGQTMASVARQYGVPLEAVVKANPELVPESLPVGTLIKVPTDGCAPPAPAAEPTAQEPLLSEPWLEVTLPDGSRAWAPRTALLMGSRNPLDSEGVLGIARRFLGTPYRWGGMTPNGVDCSGYVQEVFELAGYALPRLADDQYNATVPVETADAKAGDLVFFSTYLPGPSHVGIYLGEGRFLHASSSRGVIEARLDEEYFATRYLGLRRIKPWASPESSARLP
jgi:hypothetical protein